MRRLASLAVLAAAVVCEDVSTCLAGGGACDADRSCERVRFPSRECLAAAVPWRTPYRRVRCCFRCCLRYWQRALGLDAVYAHWRRAVAANGTEANKMLGTSKHGLPDADEVLVSHMTPFVWATTRELSRVFQPPGGLGLETLEAARAGGFGMFEGGYGALAKLPPGARWPRVVVVGTDAWLDRPALGRDARADAVEAWFFSNVKDARAPRVEPFPRALQSTDGWAELLDGAEARAAPRATLLLCGCCMRMRGERAAGLMRLRAQGFACPIGGGRPLSSYVALMSGAKFVWSPRGHGWSNHRDWEALVAGAVPVLDHHASFEVLYRELPSVQVRDWANVTPAFLEAEWARIEREAARFNMNKLYWPYWLGRFTQWMGAASADSPG